MFHKLHHILLLIVLTIISLKIYPYDFEISAKKGKEVKIVIFGDNRPAIAFEGLVGKIPRRDIASLVLQNILAENPDVIFHTGDMVKTGKLKHWDDFVKKHKDAFNLNEPEKNLFRFFPVLGNHEYKLNTKASIKRYFEIFNYLKNKKWYTVKVNQILFILLDSNFKKLSKEEFNAQNQWFKDVLTEAEKDEKIRSVAVILHHPPYTNGIYHRDNKKVQRLFVEKVKDCKKVKIFFAGHVHSFEHFYEKNIHFVTTGGAGASISPLWTGKKARHKDLYSAGKKYRNFNYVVIFLENNSMRLVLKELVDKSSTFKDTYKFILKTN